MSQCILQRSQSRVAARLYDVGWNIEQLCCGGDAMPVVERLDHDRPLLCRKRAEGFQHQEVISIARRIGGSRAGTCHGFQHGSPENTAACSIIASGFVRRIDAGISIPRCSIAPGYLEVIRTECRRISSLPGLIRYYPCCEVVRCGPFRAPRLMLTHACLRCRATRGDGSTSVTPAMPHRRLRYDIHARFGAHRRASARVDRRAPVVDSVLIAGHAGTAAAVRGPARNQRCGVISGTAPYRAGSAGTSWPRELMPSLVKTFRRW